MKFLSKVSIFLLFLFVFLRVSFPAYAVTDPLARPNNFVGIHILFTEELAKASELVNSSGGDWGYVTIPIQFTDRDLEKWQKFMNEAKQHHLIPILRLSTEPDYKNTSVWRIPTEYDIVDLANFLNSLDWPTKNRYIIVFNEVNRHDEWGGIPPNPEQYADTLDYSVDAFKARSEDFYMIMGGMDNAAPNDGQQYLNYFEYLKQMARYNPDVFKKIDGFSSHSYPNPNFAQPPSASGVVSTSTYLHEYEYINNLAGKKVPAFITETGWNNEAVSEEKIAFYYKETFTNIWKNHSDKIVAVTPFILQSHGGFDKFTFLRNGAPTKYFTAVKELSKVRGTPEYGNTVKTPLYAHEITGTPSNEADNISDDGFSNVLKFYFKSIFGL